MSLRIYIVGKHYVLLFNPFILRLPISDTCILTHMYSAHILIAISIYMNMCLFHILRPPARLYLIKTRDPHHLSAIGWLNKLFSSVAYAELSISAELLKLLHLLFRTVSVKSPGSREKFTESIKVQKTFWLSF